jgi:hypothetical protein
MKCTLQAPLDVPVVVQGAVRLEACTLVRLQQLSQLVLASQCPLSRPQSMSIVCMTLAATAWAWMRMRPICGGAGLRGRACFSRVFSWRRWLTWASRFWAAVSSSSLSWTSVAIFCAWDVMILVFSASSARRDSTTFWSSLCASSSPDSLIRDELSSLVRSSSFCFNALHSASSLVFSCTTSTLAMSVATRKPQVASLTAVTRLSQGCDFFHPSSPISCEILVRFAQRDNRLFHFLQLNWSAPGWLGRPNSTMAQRDDVPGAEHISLPRMPGPEINTTYPFRTVGCCMGNGEVVQSNTFASAIASWFSSWSTRWARSSGLSMPAIYPNEASGTTNAASFQTVTISS